jgi:hypothetical protein
MKRLIARLNAWQQKHYLVSGVLFGVLYGYFFLLYAWGTIWLLHWLPWPRSGGVK